MVKTCTGEREIFVTGPYSCATPKNARAWEQSPQPPGDFLQFKTSKILNFCVNFLKVVTGLCIPTIDNRLCLHICSFIRKFLYLWQTAIF